jgi:hypothetical protein
MNNNDFEVRFTDNIYATRQDVAKALNTQLIDSIWRNILEYRSKFCAVISLRNITKTPFRITYTPTIVSKINSVERKLSTAMVNYSSFSGNAREKFALKHKIYEDIIISLSKLYNVELSTEVIDSIINLDNKNYSILEQPIYRYFAALRQVEEHFADPINDDFYARLYSILTDNNNLTILFREKDPESATRMLINHDYTYGAPHTLVEPMCDNMTDFLVNSEQSFVVKAVAGMFFINLVKPFDEFNQEMSVLVFKSVISHGGINDVGALFPFESIVSIEQNELKRMIIESQKTNDFTYVLSYVLDKMLLNIDSLLDNIENYKIYSAKNEFRRDEQIEINEEKKAQPINNTSIPQNFDTTIDKKENIRENDSIQNVEVKKEIIAPKPTPAPIKESIIVDTKRQENKNLENEPVRFAIPKEALQLNETDANRYEEFLLESEPTMKKGQAHFFARHCTIGKYYTIQQYKRSIGVVYETARTSMENLVKLGYYKKEQIKNKFVYTPMEKK